MHFHVNKHETFYVLKGTLCVNILDTETTEATPVYVKAGESFEVNRVVPHKLSPLDEAVEFIEIAPSTRIVIVTESINDESPLPKHYLLLLR